MVDEINLDEQEINDINSIIAESINLEKKCCHPSILHPKLHNCENVANDDPDTLDCGQNLDQRQQFRSESFDRVSSAHVLGDSRVFFADTTDSTKSRKFCEEDNEVEEATTIAKPMHVSPNTISSRTPQKKTYGHHEDVERTGRHIDVTASFQCNSIDSADNDFNINNEKLMISHPEGTLQNIFMSGKTTGGILVKKISLPNYCQDNTLQIIARREPTRYLSEATRSVIKTRKLSTPERNYSERRQQIHDAYRRDISTVSLNTSINGRLISRKVPCISLETGIKASPIETDLSFQLPQKISSCDREANNFHDLRVPLSDSLTKLLVTPSIDGSSQHPFDGSLQKNVYGSNSQFDLNSDSGVFSSNRSVYSSCSGTMRRGGGDLNTATLQRKRRLPARLTIPVPDSINTDSSRPVPSIGAGVLLTLDDVKPASPSVVTFSQTPSVISNYSRNGECILKNF